MLKETAQKPTLDSQWFKDNEGYIHKAARKFLTHSSRFDTEDLKQEAAVHALHAMEKFDPTKEVKPTTYMYTAIHRGVRDFVANNKHVINIPRGEQVRQWKMDNESVPAISNIDGFCTPQRVDAVCFDNDSEWLTLSETIPSGTPLIEEDVERRETIDVVNDELDKLSARERDILRAHFMGGQTFAEIARTQGCTKQNINQIASKAKAKLKERLSIRLGVE